MKGLTNEPKTNLVITSASPEIKRQLIQGGLPESDALTHYFPDLNSGIEWCEEQLIKQTENSFDTSLSLVQQLSSALLGDHNNLTRLFGFLERLEVTPGTPIIKEGEPAEAIFFIESGQITIKMKESGESFLHLETMRNGRVIGDIGFYLGCPHAADVITVEKCILYRLSASELRQLESKKPEVASMLHRLMVRLQAERVSHLVKTVNALQK